MRIAQANIVGTPGGSILPADQRPEVGSRSPATTRDAFEPASASAVPSGELKLGDHGAKVKQLQEDLVKLGLLSKEDMATGPGVYGPHTQAALAKLQVKYGITGNGGAVFGGRTHEALKRELAKLAGTQDPKPHGAGDPRIVKTAEKFWQDGHHDPHTNDDNWEGWCLSFVRTVNKVATGKDDPDLIANTAAEAGHKMKQDGRLNGLSKKSEWKNLVPGAAIFFAGTSSNPAGHVCIFTGKFTKSGDPICITSGGWTDDHNGISKRPLSQIIAAEGEAPMGWAALK